MLIFTTVNRMAFFRFSEKVICFREKNCQKKAVERIFRQSDEKRHRTSVHRLKLEFYIILKISGTHIFTSIDNLTPLKFPYREKTASPTGTVRTIPVTCKST